MKWIRTIIYWKMMLFSVCFLCGCQKETPVLISDAQIETEQTANEDGNDRESKKETKKETICVYVCGAVFKSGVYMLPEGSRVYEAIAAAGGLTEDADEYLVNQAQLLNDGVQIMVPVKGENVQGISSAQMPESKINLNQASAEELQTLSGIGEVKAAAILAYRKEHGRFYNIEEILQVDGISEKLYEKIKEQIMV